MPHAGMNAMRIMGMLLLSFGTLACGEDESGNGSATGGAAGAGGMSGAGGAAGTGGGSGSGGSAGADAGMLTETLAHHDGQPPVGAFSPWVQTVTERSEAAVRFTPSTYPSQLKRVRINTENPAGVDVPFELRVYGDEAGLPKSADVLATAAPKPVASSSKDGWMDVEMSGVSVATGSFWVALEWDPPPLGSQNGKNSFYTTHDHTLDHPNDHATYAVDKWVTFTQAGYPIGDLLVEAVVEH